MDISAELGLHKSTVYRLLQALAARGLVRQNTATGAYRLTSVPAGDVRLRVFYTGREAPAATEEMSRARLPHQSGIGGEDGQTTSPSSQVLGSPSRCHG